MDPVVVRSASKHFGSKPAGWLFAHLVYWWPKATVTQWGKTWVVRPYGEMQEKFGCVYSERSMKRAVQILRAAGLIEVRMAPNPFRSGQMRVRWFSVTEKMEYLAETMGSDENQK